MNLIDIAIDGLKVALVAVILTLLALYGVEAWVIEDDARVAKLQRHMYDVAMRHDGPAAPTGVRPNYGEPSERNVRHFQDAFAFVKVPVALLKRSCAISGPPIHLKLMIPTRRPTREKPEPAASARWRG